MSNMKNATSRLIESVSMLGASHRIDRDAGVIHGVKIIGTESKNRKRYREGALKGAVHLYEGSKVNLNHVRSSTGATDRPLDDFWGELRDVHFKNDGLYGDLHYLKEHDRTSRILEAAERFPNKFGLSHDARGREVMTNGVVEIIEIVKVRSVDLVGCPATTNGLFESEDEIITIKELMESLAVDSKEGIALKEMIGSDSLIGDLPINASVDPMQQVKDAFRAALMSVIDNESLDLASKLSRLKGVLKAQEQASGAVGGFDGNNADPAKVDESASDDSVDPLASTSDKPDADIKPDLSAESGNVSTSNADEKKDDDVAAKLREVKESEEDMGKIEELQEQLNESNKRAEAAENRLACTVLLQESGCEFSEVRVAALVNLSESQRIELVESFKSVAPEKTRPGASPSILRESIDNSKYPETSEDFSKRLR